MRLEGLSVRWETTILPLKVVKITATKKQKQQLTERSSSNYREQQKDCSSEEEHKENALASGADEGRD